MTPVTVKDLYTNLDHSISGLRDNQSAVRNSRAIVERALNDGHTAYGINTGFGAMARQKIGPDALKQLQRNLILSHSVGTGDPLPKEISKLMMHLKAHALVIAIELFTAAQALDFRKPLKPGRGVDIAHNYVRNKIPHATEDHYFKDDISKVVSLISDHSLIEHVENELSPLQ